MIQQFLSPKIIGVVSNVNEGKSNLVYFLIEKLKQEYNFKLFVYGLRKKIEGSTELFSIEELEQIKNSVIFLDEFYTLMDLEDRTKKKQIENTLRLIHHNNNILVLIGTCDNFKKFISAKLNSIFYKKITYADLINGSSVKRIVLNYKGLEGGSTILNLAKDEVLLYDGVSYKKYNVPYLPEYDTKKDNVKILLKKSEVKS